MLKHTIALGTFALILSLPLLLSRPSLASGEAGPFVTCEPQGLQEVSNPQAPIPASHEPGLTLDLSSSEPVRRDYDLPASDLRVSLALSFTPSEQPVLGRLTIAKTFFLRTPRGLQLSNFILSPSNLFVREDESNDLELAGSPVSPGVPQLRVVIGNGNQIPRFAVDCEVVETR